MIAAFLTTQVLLGLALASYLPGARRLAPRQALRLTQLAVLLAVLLPPLLWCAPERGMAPVRMHRIFAPAEGRFRRHAKVSVLKTPEAVSVPPAATLEPETSLLDGAPLAAAALWLLCTIALLARTCVSLRKLLRLLRGGMLLRRVGKVRVIATSDTAVPFSFRSFGSCWVVLPESLLPRARDARIAVLHELQHHRQGDTLWAPLEALLHCFLFPNPAFALLRRRIAEAQEFSCDEALIVRKGICAREYGSCLVRVAETALGAQRLYAGTAYMSVGSRDPRYLKSFLLRRIEMVMEARKPRARRGLMLAAGTALTLGLFTVAYAAEGMRRSDGGANPGTAVFDPRVQEIAEKILTDAVRDSQAAEGFAVVADPQAGRILAVANVTSTGLKHGNWALSERFEPASLAKALVVAEAIEEGKTNFAEEHFCENGSYKYAGETFHDWKDVGFSKLSTALTIAKSSDICSLKIAQRLAPESARDLLARFGFGPGGTASTFPEARPGHLPGHDVNPEKELVPLVYGQGFYVTPIELVQAFGAIANGGELLAPIGANEPGRRVLRRILSKENAATMKRILETVVLKGTGKPNAASEQYTTAGKTASGYSGDVLSRLFGDHAPNPNLAGFLGFAPVASPRLEVLVEIRDPRNDKGGAHGAMHAAPVFRKIADAVLSEWGVTPDK